MRLDAQKLIFCAEVGSNHNGDASRALALIDAAAQSDFDAVKFQLFRIDDLFSPEAQRARPELALRKKYELNSTWLPELANRAREHGLLFSCTPFSLAAVNQIVDHVDFLKIASYELLWRDLLVKCGQAKLPVVLSTGMASMQEIGAAVNVLQDSGCLDLTLLHCVSSYPTPASLANLAAIETIRAQTGYSVGWSDHTADPAVIRRAVHHWGASFVEMHIDLDGAGAEFGPGHCWLPEEASALVLDIRNGSEADGDGCKQLGRAEEAERMWRADPVDGLRPMLEERRRLGLFAG